jgi:hypothetical protein
MRRIDRILTFAPRNNDRSERSIPDLGAAMSDVIRFQPTKGPRRSAPVEYGAQILFFTGVRYQRASDDPRATAPQASQVVQRQGESGGSDRTRRR